MDARRIAAIAGLAAIAGAAAVAIGVGEAEPESAPEQGTTAETSSAAPGSEAGSTSPPVETSVPSVLRDAPPLEDIDGWLQSDVTSLEELRGSVVVLQFWTYSCSNCKATLPHLQGIYAEYRDHGLEIVGVHAPEFDFEKDPAGIREAADRLGVTWPIALDTDKRNFHSWQEGPTAYWPRTYVIDREGRIRFDHIGEGAYDQLEATVTALLGEP